MTAMRTLEEVLTSLPPEREAKIRERAKLLIEEELTLRDLRRAHELTQNRMSEALNISQDGVSRIEKRSDLLLSTMRSYVEAMGGKLRILAEFPNRDPVAITTLGSIAQSDKPTRASRPRR
jgi:DNA-binding XRE family transcriptional regulator